MPSKDIKHGTDRFAGMLLPDPDELPQLELYMDQVLTVLDRTLGGYARRGEPTMTSGLINQYARAKLLPPHNRKKYSEEHLMRLSVLFFLKDVLSVADLSTLFGGMDEEAFSYLYRVLRREQEGINRAVEEAYTALCDKLCGENGMQESAVALVAALAMQADLYKRMAERVLDECLITDETGDGGEAK